LIGGAVLGIPSAILLWGFWIEPGRLVIDQQRLELPGWNAELRVAALSDLHAGSTGVDLDQVRKIVEETNAQKPDIIVSMGDFVTGGPRGHDASEFIDPDQTAAQLKNLRAPLGVYSVLGNHDLWYDGDHVRRALTSAGIHVLENRAVRIDRGAGSFWLGGIADLWTQNPDVDGTLAQVTDDAPVILFTHNPDIFPDVTRRVSLLIAGHTHGAQVNIPVYGRAVTTSKLGYVDGRYTDAGRNLYVTTGIGTSILGVRFLVPPEISMLTLAAP
jgi:predicted MPP superfamily phosphohydrolase